MKSQFRQKEIQELKESNQKLNHLPGKNFQSRQRMKQQHLYFNQDLTIQPVMIKSRRKKS